MQDLMVLGSRVPLSYFCVVPSEGLYLVYQDASSSFRHHNYIPAVEREGTKKQSLILRTLCGGCRRSLCL